jgi:hypothetical protein
MSVTIHTTQGDIKAEIFCDTCPRTAFNFLALAAAGKYNGTIFHRNIKGFMIQGTVRRPVRIRSLTPFAWSSLTFIYLVTPFTLYRNPLIDRTCLTLPPSSCKSYDDKIFLLLFKSFHDQIELMRIQLNHSSWTTVFRRWHGTCYWEEIEYLGWRSDIPRRIPSEQSPWSTWTVFDGQSRSKYQQG